MVRVSADIKTSISFFSNNSEYVVLFIREITFLAPSFFAKIEEIILATSATVEGQTTAFYIQDSLKNIDVKISKLAQGLPIGGEIESLDDGTLVSAFKNRKSLTD